MRFFITSLGQAPLGRGPRRAGGGRRLPRRHRAEVGAQGPRLRRARPDRREPAGRGPRRPAGRRGAPRTSVGDLGLPVVCAGGVGAPEEFAEALALGYAGRADGHALHRHAGVPRARRRTSRRSWTPTRTTSSSPSGSRACPWRSSARPTCGASGLRAGPLARWMLRGRRTKRWMRTFYALSLGVAAQARLAGRAGLHGVLAGRPLGRPASTRSSRPARSCGAAPRPPGRRSPVPPDARHGGTMPSTPAPSPDGAPRSTRPRRLSPPCGMAALARPARPRPGAQQGRGSRSTSRPTWRAWSAQ